MERLFFDKHTCSAQINSLLEIIVHVNIDVSKPKNPVGDWRPLLFGHTLSFLAMGACVNH